MTVNRLMNSEKFVEIIG